MNRRCAVRVTYNFEKNLVDIRRFLEEQEALPAFHSLLDQLLETLIPNLERFPELGIDFLARMPQSAEGLAHLEALKHRLGRDIRLREYITDDYLVLYALRGNDIYLLSIKHHPMSQG